MDTKDTANGINLHGTSAAAKNKSICSQPLFLREMTSRKGHKLVTIWDLNIPYIWDFAMIHMQQSYKSCCARIYRDED